MSMSTKESRLPELRLPEISREGIARGLSEIHFPDLSKLERPTIEMPELDLPRIDLGEAVAGAALAVGLTRPRPRRWPFLLGAAIIAGLTAWALMRSTAVRDRLDRASRAARERIDEMREEREEQDAVAFSAADTMPIKSGPYAANGAVDVAGALDAAVASGSDYPDGLGATTDPTAADDGIPAFEEAEARA